MDFIEGVSLTTFLKQPTQVEDAEIMLDPNTDDKTLHVIYDQLADYIYQISQFEFPLIGAVSKDAFGSWAVTRRPLTYDMNKLVTGTGYPSDQLPTSPFDSSSHFFHSIASQRFLHLDAQRNLAKDEELIPEYCVDDTGPFKLFCDDMQPSNILIDPKSLRITAIIDFEFTNSMPAQFIHDPPWWLLLRGPDEWIDRDSMDEFLACYVPRMEQFLGALERVEEKSAGDGDSDRKPRLSSKMRDSWRTGRFWFNYAARLCLDMDDIYWHTLHDRAAGDGGDLIDKATMTKLNPLFQKKMEQCKAYDEECAARFSE